MSVHKNYLATMLLLIGLAVAATVWAMTSFFGPADKTEGGTFFVSTPPAYHMVFIPKNSGNPYFEPLFTGLKIACEQTDSQVTMVAPETADATSQVEIIKSALANKPDAIFIAPNSSEALAPVLDQAIASGVTVITVDSDLTGHEKSRTASVLTVDPKQVGESQIELMGLLMDYKGKFAILSATADAPNQNSWIAVMKETLKNNPKYKAMELVDIAYSDDNPQKAITEAQALLTKHTDLAGILSPTTVGLVGAAKAVQDSGKAKTVKVTGLGSPKLMREYIKNGTVEAFTLWNPQDTGFLAGVLAQKILGKSTSATPGSTFAGGNATQREFNANGQIFTGTMLTFTRYNIDQFDF